MICVRISVEFIFCSIKSSICSSVFAVTVLSLPALYLTASPQPNPAELYHDLWKPYGNGCSFVLNTL